MQTPIMKYYTPISRSIFFISLLALPSCARLGTPFRITSLPEGAPQPLEIIANLADNEKRLTSFRASGSIYVQIPEIEAIQVSRESTLTYQAPRKLNVIGRRYGMRGLELTYVHDSFLIEFPLRREFYFRTGGAAFETISSADIVREMFSPEQWDTLKGLEIRMISYEPDTQIAGLELWTMGQPPRLKRKMQVQGVPWIILEHTLFARDGSVLAQTIKRNYHEQNGIFYPTEIECSFPGEGAWMRFIMRRVDINVAIDEAIFDLEKRAKWLADEGFTPVDIFAGEGPTLEDFTSSDN